MNRIFSVVLFSITFYCCATSGGPQINKSNLLFKDDFKSLDTAKWVAEIAPQPNSIVYVKDGKLVLDTKGGVTVWFKEKLKGDIRIEFTRTVVMDGGTNDRLSDLNMFWMATDPANANLFKRNGVLESYDSLQLYYVGMGGNSNSTTRFRKYQGNGERTLLQEYKDKEHLLEANKQYNIAIEVKGNTTSVTVNGVPFFIYNDPAILREGYFGFRSTKSRQVIDSFRVYKIK